VKKRDYWIRESGGDLPRERKKNSEAGASQSVSEGLESCEMKRGRKGGGVEGGTITFTLFFKGRKSTVLKGGGSGESILR